MAILNDSDFVEVEGRYYTNPQVALDESNKFIDNLRSTQQANNQQIQTDTYNLGTAVPSNLGGLTSPVTDGNGGAGMSYFTSRLQTPQTNSAVANLRAAAQAQALNEVLANEQAIWKNRYQNAYRNYQKRQNARANAPTPTTTTNPYANVPGDEPDYETTTPGGTGGAALSGLPGAYTVVDPAGNLHVVDMNAGDEEMIHPGQASNTRQSAAGLGGGEMRTLPNGNSVWVRPGYALTKEGSSYYLVNQSNGDRTQVGG